MKQSKVLIILILIICTVFFISCTRKHWYKPNASQNDFNQDKYTCIKESSQAFPVVIQQQTYGTGYTDPSQTTCTTSLGQTHCMTIPGTYHPPVTTSVDVNKNNRDEAFSSCMNANGWYLREKK